ncbi:UNVERIFIED_CONTAM: hypothetical protein HDU68_001079, partial [Siphonaria sp. JEL0065]
MERVDQSYDSPESTSAATASTTTNTTNVSKPRKYVDNRHKDPTPKRAQQMKDAQKAHRIRKAEYVKDLETQVATLNREAKQMDAIKERMAQLEFENSLLKSSSTGYMNIEKSICASCLIKDIRIRTLESQLLTPQATGDANSLSATSASPPTFIQLPPHSDSTSTLGNELISSNVLDFDTVMDDLDVFLSSIAPRPITAEELYGPAEVESTRLSLQMIPSLKNCPHVSEICDLFAGFARTSDILTLKRNMLKYVRAIDSMFRSCHVLDKPRVFEIFAMHYERNLLHAQYTVQIWVAFLPPLPKSTAQVFANNESMNNESMTYFRTRVDSLPSMKGSKSLIDDFCETL